jgi:hypothetical protein
MVTAFLKPCQSYTGSHTFEPLRLELIFGGREEVDYRLLSSPSVQSSHTRRKF